MVEETKKYGRMFRERNMSKDDHFEAEMGPCDKGARSLSGKELSPRWRTSSKKSAKVNEQRQVLRDKVDDLIAIQTTMEESDSELKNLRALLHVERKRRDAS